jgi:hypothetical protein
LLARTLALAIAVALCLPVAASAATPRKGSGYLGSTSQGEMLTFDVSKSGNRMLALETSLTYTCTGEHDGQGGSFILDDIKVKDGKFSSKQTLKGTSETSVVASGLGTLKGSFKRKGNRARGTIRSTLQLSSGETCDSGKVKFTADAI